MKGPKKGIKVSIQTYNCLQFGAKKGGLDDFIEAEMNNITAKREIDNVEENEPKQKQEKLALKPFDIKKGPKILVKPIHVAP